MGEVTAAVMKIDGCPQSCAGVDNQEKYDPNFFHYENFAM
jgi:hypothetical protein